MCQSVQYLRREWGATIWFLAQADIFSFLHAVKLALGPFSPPSTGQCGSCIMRKAAWSWPLTSLEARFSMYASIPSLPHMPSWHGADLSRGIPYLYMAQTYVCSLNCVVLPSSFKWSGGSVSHSCGCTLCADIHEMFFQRSNDVRGRAAFQFGLSQ